MVTDVIKSAYLMLILSGLSIQNKVNLILAIPLAGILIKSILNEDKRINKNQISLKSFIFKLLMMYGVNNGINNV